MTIYLNIFLIMKVSSLNFHLIFPYLYLHMIIDLHIKNNPSTEIHGSLAVVTASSLGMFFTYMVHQY